MAVTPQIEAVLKKAREKLRVAEMLVANEAWVMREIFANLVYGRGLSV